MKCRKCGGEVYDGGRTCYKCRRAFAENRKRLYAEAERLYGKTSKDNLAKIQAFMKARERTK